MTTREEVVVRAGFDNTTIAQGLRGTKAMIQEFATTAVSYLSGIFGAWQAVAFARGIVDWAKNISLVSERLNVGTTAAQQFSYAAKLTGVELDDVAASLDRLAKAKETATGGGPASIPMLAAFRQFGISLHDIQTMTPETLFDRIAQSVARTGANAAVTAAAMELFGRAGGKLIPLLAQFEAIKKRTP
ncbi:MAG TPA: hypothetical protein VMJ12_02830, partial [Candidatus Acidoferrales bacterium]|nr:hypothetical protein [Candidatus Acidoferrales bacterium]